MRSRLKFPPHEKYHYIYTLLYVNTILLSGVLCGSAEIRLIDDLLAKYRKYERPSREESSPLTVEFTVTLQQIMDMDEKNQVINTNLWLSMQWIDYKLAWDPLQYNNLTEIRLPETLLWKPDILMYNSASRTFDGSWPVNMVVTYTGLIQQLPPGIFTSSCPIDIKWFPFDTQSCKLKFGSWTYDGTKIDLRMLSNATTGSTDGYRRSGEWDLLGFPAIRNVVLYECCPDNPYIDLTFSIDIRRRKLYYMVNIVLPCVMLAALTLLTFTIPCDAGEKISFGVTILLSLTVFLLLVAEALPATSDAVPLIAIYFSCVMLMNAASVVFSVLVLSYHHRNSTTHNMPKWVNRVICGWLAWLLRLERPETYYSLSELVSNHQSSITVRRASTRKATAGAVNLEMREYTSANTDCNGHANTGLLTSSYREGETTPSLPNSPQLNGTDFKQFRPMNHLSGGGIAPPKMFSDTNTSRTELRQLLKEVSFITDRIRRQQEEEQITADWKFAASVLDRFLLWVFFVFILLCSCSILLSVPGIFDTGGAIG